MPKHILTSFLSFLCLMVVFVNTGSAKVRVKQSDNGTLILSYRPGHTSYDSLYVNDTLYQTINYDGHSFRTEEGQPLLPSETVFFAAPEGITPSLDISDISVTTRSNITITPTPVLSVDGAGFAQSEYHEDPTSYSMSGNQPGEFATLVGNVTRDGITVWRVTLNPVQFDAFRSSVACADSFTVTVSFGAVKMSNIRVTSRVPDYVVNRASFPYFPRNAAPRKSAEYAQSPFAEDEWYRISLTETGMYVLTGSDLKNAGFQSGAVASDEIKMYYGGGRVLSADPVDVTADTFREIAVKINDGGDGIFHDEDQIIFFGQGLSRFVVESGEPRPTYQNYPYADVGENVYWLKVSSNGAPKRMTSFGEAPSSDITATRSYREFIHTEPETYLEWIDNHNTEAGTEWYWAAISVETEQFSFDAPGIVAGDSTKIRIGFRNGMAIVKDLVRLYNFHNLNIRVNNEQLGDYFINTARSRYIEIAMADQLKEDTNYLYIRRMANGPNENVRLDWLEVEYAREFKLQNNAIEFFSLGTGAPVKYEIAHATTPAVKIYNTTDPYNVKEHFNPVYDSGRNTVTFQATVPPDTITRYTICSSNNYRRLPSSAITKKTRTNLRSPQNGASYFIIFNEKFLDQAKRLADWRARDSLIDPLTTKVVDINDVYDEFAWGVYDPTAIRDYLMYLKRYATPAIRYCCFFGDTTYKYKNLDEGQASQNLVPTYTAISQNLGLATDDYFAWFDDNHIPEVALGRLCVNTKESAKIIVDKIIAYEQEPENGIWHNRVLLIGDDEYGFQGTVYRSNAIFTENIEDIDTGGFIPQSFECKKILLIEYPIVNLRKPEVTEDLFSAINDGYLIMNYIGHGNNDVLAHEYILKGSRDIERYNNGARQSLFLVFSCAVAQFDKPDNISLAEQLNLRMDGGCIAVIAATRFTSNTRNVNLNKTFYQYFFDQSSNPEYRLGESLARGKAQHHGDNNSNRYVLIGDPATRIANPRLHFNLADIDSICRLQKLDIVGSVQGENTTIPYEGTLSVKARGPRIYKTYSANKLLIDYTAPGKLFHYGEYAISGENFTSSFVVPKDLSESNHGGSESKIFFFATGQDEEAAGVIENFSIGGIFPNAPDDRSAPEIRFSFDGKLFNDGDYIRRQPNMTVEISDESGINIMGNRGHNIKLLIDKSDSYVLTDRFMTINGYTTGTVEYQLPVLSPGEHLFEFTAYDTYNNAAKKTVTVNVVGSESGDVAIINPLNYPNPMENDGTTFTFSLDDDVRSSNIKVYSQSGRLIDTVPCSPEYGFNQIFWKPPVTLANGVYFYKISIVTMNGRKSSKIEKLVVME